MTYKEYMFHFKRNAADVAKYTKSGFFDLALISAFRFLAGMLAIICKTIFLTALIMLAAFSINQNSNRVRARWR